MASPPARRAGQPLDGRAGRRRAGSRPSAAVPRATMPAPRARPAVRRTPSTSAQRALPDPGDRDDQLSSHTGSVATPGVATVSDTLRQLTIAAIAAGPPRWRAITSGASGSVRGRNRLTTSPPGASRNFSKFHCTSPASPSASAVLVSSAYSGCRSAPLTSVLASSGNVTP